MSRSFPRIGGGIPSTRGTSSKGAPAGGGAAAADPWTAAGLAAIMGLNAPTHFWEYSGASPYTDTEGSLVLTRDGTAGYTEQDASTFYGRNGVSFSGAANVGYKTIANQCDINNTTSGVFLTICENIGATTGDRYYSLGRGGAWNYLFYDSNTVYKWNTDGSTDSETVAITTARPFPDCAMGVSDATNEIFQIHTADGSSAGQTVEGNSLNNSVGYIVGGSLSQGVPGPIARIMATAVWLGSNAEQNFVAGHAALLTHFGL